MGGANARPRAAQVSRCHRRRRRATLGLRPAAILAVHRQPSARSSARPSARRLGMTLPVWLLRGLGGWRREIHRRCKGPGCQIKAPVAPRCCSTRRGRRRRRKRSPCLRLGSSLTSPPTTRERPPCPLCPSRRRTARATRPAAPERVSGVPPRRRRRAPHLRRRRPTGLRAPRGGSSPRRATEEHALGSSPSAG